MYEYMEKTNKKAGRTKRRQTIQRIKAPAKNTDYIKRLNEVLPQGFSVGNWTFPVISAGKSTAASIPHTIKIYRATEDLTVHMMFEFTRFHLTGNTGTNIYLNVDIHNIHFTARPLSLQSLATADESSSNEQISHKSVHWNVMATPTMPHMEELASHLGVTSQIIVNKLQLYDNPVMYVPEIKNAILYKVKRDMDEADVDRLNYAFQYSS